MGGCCMNRREFTTLTAAGIAGSVLALSAPLRAEDLPLESYDPDKPPVVTGQPLKVQPILMHAVYTPREKTSWRSWSRIINEPAAAEERQRIEAEMKALAAKATFPLDLLPLAKVTSPEAAAQVHQGDYDVVLLFAASGGANLLHACFAPKSERDTLVFVRHRSGPTYYWYEAMSTRVVKTPTPELWAKNTARNHGGVTLDDAVVDDYAEVLWRLRALYGLKNFVGQRVLALGGAQGKWDGRAPAVARERFLLQITDIPYEQLGTALQAARANPKLLQQARQATDRYLALRRTRLETKRDFVANAFVLYAIFKDWMREHKAPALTINQCMGTIIGMSDTTACMPLSWLNDEGWLAFCESDFVIIPCGILAHYVSGKPVFLHNSTFPHRGIVTCAHCTAPRRMDGKHYAPARILTHYESDFGAAPKVDYPVGQQVTFLDPEYSTGRWLGFRGVVRDNPFLDICRSQQDVEIQGDWRKLLAETRDSHWIMVYGDHLRELGYAARKIGLQWTNLSEA